MNFDQKTNTFNEEVQSNGAIGSIDYSRLLPAERSGAKQSRSLRALNAESEYYTTLEQNRAALAYNVLNNTAALSAVENALAESVPNAEPRLKAIVDAYAAGGIVRVARY